MKLWGGAMAGQRRSESRLYGKAKVSKQFMITENLATIDELADELGLSRSETLERVIRTFNPEDVKKYNPDESSLYRFVSLDRLSRVPQ